MANLESFKDVRTVASVSALVAVGVSTSYFLNEISKIKEKQAEIERHLASIIPLVNPEVAKHLNDTMAAMKVLDSRLAKAQDDIKIISSSTQNIEEKQPNKRVYTRLTQRGVTTPIQEVVKHPKFTAHVVNNQEVLDIDDDIAAMMG
jgi:hypothetical protein